MMTINSTWLFTLAITCVSFSESLHIPGATSQEAIESGEQLSKCSDHIEPLLTQEYSSGSLSVPFQSMVVFGDSYSDVGNIYSASNGVSPPQSWNGRYSDGPVWIEYVAKYFDLPKLRSSSDHDVDFAWGGATSNNSYIPAYSTYLDGAIPAVNDQIQQYVKGSTKEINDGVLHVLWSGYNDYWWYVYRNFTVGTDDYYNDDLIQVASNVARYVVNNVEELYNNGARLFMVVNLHDMSTVPEVLTYDDNEGITNTYNVLVSFHNNYLGEYLDDFQLKYKDAIIYRPNAYHAFNCISPRNKNLFGFFNTVNAFYDGSSDDNEDKDAIFTYKWWDLYHPTTHTHKVFASSVIQTVLEYHSNE